MLQGQSVDGAQRARTMVAFIQASPDRDLNLERSKAKKMLYSLLRDKKHGFQMVFIPASPDFFTCLCMWN